MKNKKVKIENVDYIPAKRKGTILIKTNQDIKIILGVLCVHDIDKNLLSVGQLIRKEFKLLLDKTIINFFIPLSRRFTS